MKIKTRINLAVRGYGKSLGNMIEMLSGEAANKQKGNWIEVERKGSGLFVVTDDNLTEKGDDPSDQSSLGFIQWDSEVVDLDNGESDEGQCFGMSNHLKWKDVDMTPHEYKAPNIKRLKEALQHVAICAWCPWDI